MGTSNAQCFGIRKVSQTYQPNVTHIIFQGKIVASGTYDQLKNDLAELQRTFNDSSNYNNERFRSKDVNIKGDMKEHEGNKWVTCRSVLY